MCSGERADVVRIHYRQVRRAPTLLDTSNRDPSEFLAQMADPLLAQSAVDRLQSAAYELVIEGESYRKRQKPRAGSGTDVTETCRRSRYSLAGRLRYSPSGCGCWSSPKTSAPGR